jgi:hypothetical protein
MSDKDWYQKRDLIAKHLKAQDNVMLTLVGDCTEYFIADNIMYLLYGENKTRGIKK